METKGVVVSTPWGTLTLAVGATVGPTLVTSQPNFILAASRQTQSPLTPPKLIHFAISTSTEQGV